MSLASEIIMVKSLDKSLKIPIHAINISDLTYMNDIYIKERVK